MSFWLSRFFKREPEETAEARKARIGLLGLDTNIPGIPNIPGNIWQSPVQELKSTITGTNGGVKRSSAVPNPFGDDF